MERTKVLEKISGTAFEGVYRWRKLGRGSLRLKGRIIKPNEVFEAREEDIPAAFRDVIIPVDHIKDATPLHVETTTYSMRPRGKSKTWFDVVDGDGKLMNEKALKEQEAEKLLSDLIK